MIFISWIIYGTFKGKKTSVQTLESNNPPQIPDNTMARFNQPYQQNIPVYQGPVYSVPVAVGVPQAAPIPMYQQPSAVIHQAPAPAKFSLNPSSNPAPTQAPIYPKRILVPAQEYQPLVEKSLEEEKAA